MIAIIRIRGLVGIKRDADETLNRLRLRRKYACVVVREKKEVLGMIKKIENFIAYGKIDRETFLELVKKRGKSLTGKKIDADALIKEFIEGKIEKGFFQLGIKPFFRLHPPRGGINSKKHFPKGVLGNHGEKINLLIRRML